jgi:hypothetical protein
MIIILLMHQMFFPKNKIKEGLGGVHSEKTSVSISVQQSSSIIRDRISSDEIQTLAICSSHLPSDTNIINIGGTSKNVIGLGRR